MGKMNAGNWGALLQGTVQGAETGQQMESNDLHNRYYKDAFTDPASEINAYYTRVGQQKDVKDGVTPWQSQGMLFDPVRAKAHDVYSAAVAKLQSWLGPNQHASGPASQSTVNQQTNVAPSAPGPSSSNPASGGVPGATGPMVTPQPTGTTTTFANGGPIPGRGGALRMRKPKPGNVAKPTKAAQAAMHPPMEKPPVDNQEMGAEGGPPRNTDAQPGSQDPMLADGGFLPSRFNPKPAAMPKPNPNSFEKNEKNDSQLSRFSRVEKKFADGSPDAVQPDPPYNKDAPSEMSRRAAQSRASNPASVSSSTTSAVNDTTAPAAGLEGAEVAPKGILSKVTARAKGMGMGPKVGTAVAGAIMLGQAADTNDTTTDSYYQRLGLNPPTNAAAGGIGPFLEETGVRGLGYATDLGNTLTNGGLQKAHDYLYPNYPWNADGRQPQIDLGHSAGPGQAAPQPSAVPPPPQQPAAVPATGPVPPRAAGPQGPPRPAAPPQEPPMDFSKVDINHEDIPATHLEDWDKMKQGIVSQLVHTRQAGPEMASIMADDQVSKFQHENFMQYLQQGAALDAAGNKQGAMAAYKTAYQYMPTGHDMGFGVTTQPQKKSDGTVVPVGTIVGYGRDEKTGHPVGAPVLLDQANVNHLAATFQDPKQFQAMNLEMQEQARKNRQTNAEVPLFHAQTKEALERGDFYENNDPTKLMIAQMRAAGAGGSRADPQTQKFYAQQLNGAIVDPGEQGEAINLAAALQQKVGSSSVAQAKIVGFVKQLYAHPPEQRAEFARSQGIDLQGMMGGGTPQIPPMTGWDPSLGIPYRR